jgi:hypothetical protein
MIMRMVRTPKVRFVPLAGSHPVEFLLDQLSELLLAPTVVAVACPAHGTVAAAARIRDMGCSVGFGGGLRHRLELYAEGHVTAIAEMLSCTVLPKTLFENRQMYNANKGE